MCKKNSKMAYQGKQHLEHKTNTPKDGQAWENSRDLPGANQGWQLSQPGPHYPRALNWSLFLPPPQSPALFLLSPRWVLYRSTVSPPSGLLCHGLWRNWSLLIYFANAFISNHLLLPPSAVFFFFGGISNTGNHLDLILLTFSAGDIDAATQ